MFNEKVYDKLHKIVFCGDYPGYTPQVVESPNGDGKLDSAKRYAHISQKNILPYSESNPDDAGVLTHYLLHAHGQAVEMAKAMGIDEKYYPDLRYGALRLVEYPPGAIANPHTDFDLFTLMIYRNLPEHFEYIGGEPESSLRDLNHQLHYGEILDEIGFAKPSPHQVTASDKTQKSMVYFAIPDWDVTLPSGLTVGEWIAERIKRSRY